MIFAATSGLPQLDVSNYPNVLFWLFITFGALFLFVRQSGIAGVQEVLDARENKISGDLAQARELGREAESLKESYEVKLVEAKASAQEEVREALNRVAQEAQMRQDALNARLAEDMRKREGELEAQTQVALGELDQMATELVKAAATRFGDYDTSRAEALLKEGS